MPMVFHYLLLLNQKSLFMIRSITIFCFLVFFNYVQAQELLPPTIPWDGKSIELIKSESHKWQTPIEKSNFTFTPTHAETMKWLSKLVASSDLLTMLKIGESPNGLDINMVIASTESNRSANALARSNKPMLLAQAGIHAGEIDGKDAGMMLLRDIAHGNQKELIEKVNLLFIPILSVDGHERSSPYNRVNQRGPSNMGWRTNAQNLNLNRDYTKLDTRELQSAIKVINDYDPDLYMDIHVTDGADYQYDITYGYMADHGYSPNISRWLEGTFRPAVDGGLANWGHIPGPLMFSVGGGDFSKGNLDYAFGPIFSHAYGDARHLPTILVENHSLKPYRQRVLGTYILLQETLKALERNSKELERAIVLDRSSRPEKIPLGWEVPQFSESRRFGESGSGEKLEISGPVDSMLLLGVKSEMKSSSNTGGEYLQWTGKPYQKMIPYFKSDKASRWVDIPKTYYLPPSWSDVINRLEMHGIEMTYLGQPKTITVEKYHVENPEISKRAFEGRVKMEATVSGVVTEESFPKGTAVISTDQPLGILATLLLEPDGSDSFFQWGFFMSILSRTEYIESYAVEPMITQMLKSDPELQKRFEEKKAAEPDFAKSPRAISQWFYRQSPYYDERYLVYPVGIVR